MGDVYETRRWHALLGLDKGRWGESKSFEKETKTQSTYAMLNQDDKGMAISRTHNSFPRKKEKRPRNLQKETRLMAALLPW